MTEQSYPEFPATVSSTWELVTPVTAEKYLQQNTHNRHMKRRHVEGMTDDMRRGRFPITHQGLAFDEDGVMLDGQQRCQAVINSGVSIWMLVTTGLPRASQQMMDLGAKRLVGDFLEGNYPANRAAAYRILTVAIPLLPTIDPVRVKEEMGKLTTPRVLEFVAEHPDLLESVDPITGLSKEASKNLPAISPSPLIAAIALTFGKDTDRSVDFLEGIRQMTDLKRGDPRLALIKFRGKEGKHTQQAAAFGISLRMTQAYKHGRDYGVIRGMWAPVKVEP